MSGKNRHRKKLLSFQTSIPFFYVLGSVSTCALYLTSASRTFCRELRDLQQVV